jgi:hypothetical protein
MMRNLASWNPQEHARYEQLCGLASSGALRAEEWKRLAEHLKVCGACCAEIAQYQEIATFGISLTAPNDVGLELENEWSPESAVAKLMRKLQEQGSSFDAPPQKSIASRQTSALRFSILFPRLRTALAYAAVIAACLGLSSWFYVIGIKKGEQRVNVEPVSSTQSGSTLDALLRQRSDLENQVKSGSDEIARVSHQLVQQATVIEELRADKQSSDQQTSKLTQRSKDQETENAELRSRYDAIQQERSALAEKLKNSEAALVAMQHNFEAAKDQHAADLTQLAKLEDQISTFNRDVHPAQFIDARQLSSDDPDLRALMGARDLFIADVFDIDKAGSPRKPFGRVFYTRGKSLLFYAFDLDKQPGAKAASTFQVWGRRGYGDSHPLNMGMMYMESATSKRWVLSYSDAKALSQVDAVFVTVEPHGGSETPKGRQLLYASLRTPPNHP